MIPVSFPLVCLILHLLIAVPPEIIVGFSPTVYITTESEGIVELSVQITTPLSGGAPRAFSLSLTSENGIASLSSMFCSDV